MSFTGLTTDRGVILCFSLCARCFSRRLCVSSIARCIEAGVKIAMGTDSGVTPHGRNLTELSEMTSLGMSDQATWEASTRVAAELMGIDDTTGTLEPGKVADIAIWDGTDLDVADLKARVHTVIQDGKIVVEGVNVAARHRKPTQQNPQGERVQEETPIHVSNVMHLDPATGKGTRRRPGKEAN